MATVLTIAGQKLFEKNLEKYAPADPLYENYTDDEGRQQRRKRELPPGLSKRDESILRTVKKHAHRLDKGISLCGLRVGYSFFLGLIPIVGDAAEFLLSYHLVVRPARRADLPPWLLQSMLGNCAVSTGLGLVPLAGDVAAAVFRANTRNVALLEELLRLRGAEFLHVHGPDAVHEEEEEEEEEEEARGWFARRAKKGAKGVGKKIDSEPGEGEKGAAGELPPPDVEALPDLPKHAQGTPAGPSPDGTAD